MATVTMSFILILFLSLVSKGFCACSLDNININTIRSGREIQGKPEWNVTVINNCNCPQKLIKLTCKGFQTLENVDPSILSKVGDKCLLIGGNQLGGSASVKFSYAWDPAYIFWPSESTIVGCGKKS
ncbi:hypothetical protein SO802_003502 [Lithocarpus litseifolius]|uniref:Uncharacterized protein n=1 Tax=Lithocarpus litseifolius TaxID=425828 RepID=A0AAW2E454_9ROSI